MEKAIHHIKHRNLTIIKLVALTIITIAIIFLAFWFNLVSFLSAYAVLGISFLAYCGAFAYIGIDDFFYYYYRWVLKKYLNKSCQIRFLIFDIKEHKVREKDYDFFIEAGDFDFKNRLYFSLLSRNNDKNYRIFAKINPFTNGITLTHEYGDEFTKFLGASVSYFQMYKHYVLKLSHYEFFNPNNLRLRNVKAEV